MKQSLCLAAEQPTARFGKVLSASSPSRDAIAEIAARGPEDGQPLTVKSAPGGQETATIQPPTDREHWNYPTSLAWSPDGKLILAGSEAGSSDAHFEDYWLLDWAHQTWEYAGGGNSARWSPDGSQIVWTTARELAPLGKRQVWVSHLVLLNAVSLKQQTVTSGVSTESEFFWCAADR